MQSPLDRIAARVDSMISRAESGQTIDWERECMLSDIDTIAAGVHYAQQAVSRVNDADADHIAAQSAADETLYGK